MFTNHAYAYVYEMQVAGAAFEFQSSRVYLQI